MGDIHDKDARRAVRKASRSNSASETTTSGPKLKRRYKQIAPGESAGIPAGPKNLADQKGSLPQAPRPADFLYTIDQMKQFRGVDIRGSITNSIELSPGLVDALESGTAKLRLSFSEGVEDIRIRLANFRGVLNIGFKGKNAQFIMGPCRQVSADVLFYSDSSLRIGQNTSINSCNIVLSDASVSIGNDCMFSHNITLQPSDQHGIVDLITRKIVNSKRGIQIGDHVWLGKGASICPGTTIGDGAIVGMGSVVAKDVPSCSLVAGNPARVIKSGVTWCREMDQIDGQTLLFLDRLAPQQT